MPLSAAALTIALATIAAPTEDEIADLGARWKTAMDAEIAGLKRRFKGRISVYASDPTLGVRYAYDCEKPSYLASGVKVPFMIEVFRQAKQGRLSMDETISYDEDDVRDGAPRMAKVPFGTKMSVRELIRIMVQNSDNSASDMLAGRVGIDNVNAGLAAQELHGFSRLTYLLDVRRAVFREVDPRADDLTNVEVRDIRWTWGWKKHAAKFCEKLGRPKGTYSPEEIQAAYDRYYALGVNHVRVDALGALMERMLRGELVSPEASAEMLGIMRGAKTSTKRIMGLLPKGVRVAHKTGSQYERICDYGVIDLPDGKPLVFASCLAGGKDRNLAELTLAKAARRAYDLAVDAHR